jgi:hypothetical protein
MRPAVGTTLDGAESVSEIEDGGIAFAKTDVDRLGHLAWESGMGWGAILPADLVDKRRPCGEVLLNITARRRGKGNVSRVDVWRL